MSRASAFAEGTHPDRGFASVFVTAPEGLRLHIRSYGSSVASALPVVCLPALARTAADFHPLAAALAANCMTRGRVVIQFGPTAPPNKFFQMLAPAGDIRETSTPVPPPEFLYRTRDRSSLHRREPIEALFLLISE